MKRNNVFRLGIKSWWLVAYRYENWDIFLSSTFEPQHFSADTF